MKDWFRADMLLAYLGLGLLAYIAFSAFMVAFQ